MKRITVLLIFIVVALIVGFIVLTQRKNDLKPRIPDGYTLSQYTIEKTTDQSCTHDLDCETPGEYLVLSRCPFTSLCLQNKCTVICPQNQNTISPRE